MHYTVAVVTNENDEDEIDLLLAPYDENIEVDPYIYKTKEEKYGKKTIFYSVISLIIIIFAA